MTIESLGWWRFPLSFLLMFAVDVVWAVGVLYAVERRPIHAAVASGVLFMLSSVTTLLFVADARCLVAACVGGSAGAYAAVRWAKR